ncbi:MAG: LysR substrate-binding domain-containing protein [Pseudomonadales bacterium]
MIGEFDINKIRRLDGGLLLVFRELLRCRNASEASRRLHLSPSAVTHSLNRLRDLFEDPLFVRRSHGFEPTNRALELGPRIEALIASTTDILSEQGGFDPKRSERRFSIGAPEFLTVLIGAPLVDALQRQAPNASVDIWHLSRDQALSAMRRGEIDLAVGRFGVLSGAGLDVRLLYEDVYCVVARQKHPEIRGKVSKRQYIDTGHVFASSFSEGGPGERIPAPSVVSTAAVVPHWLTAMMIVSKTDLIASVPRQLAASQARALKLQVLESPYSDERWTVSAVRRTDREDAGVDWLLREIQDVCTPMSSE